MHEKRDHMLPYSLWNVPFLDEDFPRTDVAAQTGVSISEDKNHVYVEAHVPGLGPEDIELSFEGGILWIRGEKKEEDVQKKYYRKASSSFSYKVQIRGQVDERKEPEASYKNGVIKVVFGKLQGPQSKKIPIKT